MRYTPTAGLQRSAKPVRPQRRRRIFIGLNAAAMLATTAFFAALDPKSPPFRGD